MKQALEFGVAPVDFVQFAFLVNVVDEVLANYVHLSERILNLTGCDADIRLVAVATKSFVA
jgi:hypothetical protein